MQLTEIGTFDLTAFATPTAPERGQGKRPRKATASGPYLRIPARAKAPRLAKAKRAGHGPHCRVWQEDFYVNIVWQASWKGQRSSGSFASEALARAFLASCDVAQRLRY